MNCFTILCTLCVPRLAKKSLLNLHIFIYLHINRNFHNIVAYLVICDSIEQSIMRFKKIVLLNVLHNDYLYLLYELNNGLFDDSSYTLQHIEDKFKKKPFESKIKFEVLNNKRIILYIGFPLSKVSLSNLKNNSVLLYVAQILHRKVLKIKNKTLPENVSNEDLIN